MYDDQLLLRTREGAILLGISVSLMAKLVAEGTIPSITIGRARRIVRADLDRFVADRIAEAQRPGEPGDPRPFSRPTTPSSEEGTIRLPREGL